MRYLILGLFLLTLFPSSSVAGDLEMGEVGIYLDPAGTQRTDVIAPFTVFDLYVVARVPAGGLDRYYMPTPQFTGGSFVAMGLATLPEDTEFQMSVVLDTCPLAFPLDPAGCPVGEGEVVALSRTQVLINGFDIELCVEDFLCPSFGGPAIHSNQFIDCDDPGVIREFVLGPNRCIRVDGTVATEFSSWSAVKGHYRQN